MKKTYFQIILTIFFLCVNISFLKAQVQEQLEIEGNAKVNGTLKINDPNQTGYQLPTTDGNQDQVLSTNGNGNLSWSSMHSGSTINHQGQTALPAMQRTFFVKIEGAPSQHNFNLPGIDNTEITSYGYEFSQQSESNGDCSAIQFKIRKELDRSSPLLKEINFNQDIINELKLFVFIRGVNQLLFLESSLFFENVTIKSIDMVTVHSVGGNYQLYEEITFNILDVIEMEYFWYDQTGSLSGSTGSSFNCNN